MPKGFHLVVLRTLAALCCLAASPARAQDADAAFFNGRVVRLIVGFGTGGGYDAYARMIAPYIGRELGANVIVENQPGAGGVTALNSFFIAPPDGSRIMLANGWSNGMSQLMGAPGVRFDLDKVSHLGIVSASPSVWIVRKDSPWRSINDARKATGQINWSGMSPDDGLFIGARVTCKALRLNCSIVLGYKSSNEAGLALARGEMDSVFIGDTSANDYTRMGDARALSTMARTRSRFFPDLPTVFEMEKLSQDEEWLLDFEASFERLGRILILPPDAPAARLAFVRAAIARAMHAPGLIEEGERTQRYINYVDPESTQETVRRTIGRLTETQKAMVRDLLSSGEQTTRR